MKKIKYKVVWKKQVFHKKWNISEMLTCGEGGVPDEREGVVEDVCWVGPRVAGIHHIGPIALSQLHLHKLGKVLFNSPH